MRASDRVWVILRSSQYIRHVVVNKYFTSEVAALAYIEEHGIKKGAIPEPLDLAR